MKNLLRQTVLYEEFRKYLIYTFGLIKYTDSRKNGVSFKWYITKNLKTILNKKCNIRLSDTNIRLNDKNNIKQLTSKIKETIIKDWPSVNNRIEVKIIKHWLKNRNSFRIILRER